MKVLIKRTCAAQGQHLEQGGTYELDSLVASDLIRMGRAVEAPAEMKLPARKAKANAAD
jgi:hypothetical protein